MTLHSLKTLPQTLYSKIDLILHRNVIILVGCIGEFMMWCLLISTHDVDLEDDGI